ncbi:hypothetical protein G8759_11270 [Spirosoma aureum]|uniref:DUF6883 domain-containing protein n=1 Tax=Spirosoma aureum TaxID=2692134 RepID=A0A6G9ALS8_9BACT|nr:DUF6883 domain-containing protein [Spirosoma aureum]QIP13163.1 hypothetical protein G8759_11270 [Spirosoma aureum]
MLLPFAEKAYIDNQKLVDYCLSETHNTGKHKARVFKSVLGLTATDYFLLKETILTEILLNEVQAAGPNQQGDLYTVDFTMTHQGRTATIRTAWIIIFNESFPRLVSCYIND